MADVAVFKSEVKPDWCPGCGDYGILAAMQFFHTELDVKREDTVFVSGIGCSSRFPYYMNTYGLHTIHGRAPAIASGLKLARPELNVVLVTGDGDGLSIGASHLLHLFRRNIDVTVLLFNNQIYGLTKGQYSPTSVQGQKAKSTPFGSLEEPINPILFALSAQCSFVTLNRLQQFLLVDSSIRCLVNCHFQLQNSIFFLNNQPNEEN